MITHHNFQAFKGHNLEAKTCSIYHPNTIREILAKITYHYNLLLNMIILYILRLIWISFVAAFSVPENESITQTMSNKFSSSLTALPWRRRSIQINRMNHSKIFSLTQKLPLDQTLLSFLKMHSYISNNMEETIPIPAVHNIKTSVPSWSHLKWIRIQNLYFVATLQSFYTLKHDYNKELWDNTFTQSVFLQI